MAKNKPTQTPIQAEKVEGTESFGGQSVPVPLKEAELALMVGDAVPTLKPPAAEMEEEAIGAWFQSKQLNALWAINQNRNSWINVVGIGWKKLSTTSESGNVALTMLAAHARQLNRSVNYREEADGMIHELYVW